MCSTGGWCPSSILGGRGGGSASMFNPLMKYSQARRESSFPGCRRCLSRGSPRQEDTGVMKSGCSVEQSPRDRGWTPTARGQHLARPSTPARPPPAPPVWTCQTAVGGRAPGGGRCGPRSPDVPAGLLAPVPPHLTSNASVTPSRELGPPTAASSAAGLAPNTNTPSRSGIRTPKPPTLLVKGEGTLRQAGRGSALPSMAPQTPAHHGQGHGRAGRGVTRPLDL